MANVALVSVLFYPFPDSVVSVWLPLTAVPYFLLYARDLAQAGYKGSDVGRVYALNLLLVPVNLAGVLKSLEQAWTKRKIPFGRTPKVQDRTAAPARYLLAEVLLIQALALASASDLAAGRLLDALFSAANLVLLVYAIDRYVGWCQLVWDIQAQMDSAFARWLTDRTPCRGRVVRPATPPVRFKKLSLDESSAAGPTACTRRFIGQAARTARCKTRPLEWTRCCGPG